MSWSLAALVGIPLAAAFLMAVHFWRVRKARGLVLPRKPDEAPEEKPDRVPTLPDLLLREVVGRLRGHPGVWAWNLGNEPDNFALPPDDAAGAGWAGGAWSDSAANAL